jgi:hypothetical protein
MTHHLSNTVYRALRHNTDIDTDIDTDNEYRLPLDREARDTLCN